MVLLSGKLALLRPVGREDYSLLVKWSSAPEATHPLAGLFAANLFRLSERSIEQLLDDESILMVCAATDETFGYAMLYNVNPVNRHLNVGLFALEDCRPAVEMEAWLLLLDHVFAWYPVNVVYRHVVDVNPVDISLSISMGFEEEGALKDNVWFDHRFWTLHILALRREQWTNLGRQRFTDNIDYQIRYEQHAAALER